MDRLAELYSRQRELTLEVLEFRGVDLDNMANADLVDLSRYYLLALHKEISEVLDNIDGWKLHRPLSDVESTKETESNGPTG